MIIFFSEEQAVNLCHFALTIFTLHSTFLQQQIHIFFNTHILPLTGSTKEGKPQNACGKECRKWKYLQIVYKND